MTISTLKSLLEYENVKIAVTVYQKEEIMYLFAPSLWENLLFMGLTITFQANVEVVKENTAQ